VNQTVILAGYWWIGVLDGHVWRLAASFAPPAAGGTALGMLLFGYVDFRALPPDCVGEGGPGGE